MDGEWEAKFDRLAALWEPYEEMTVVSRASLDSEPQQLAHRGKCVFVRLRDKHRSFVCYPLQPGEKNYVSPIVLNPIWSDVLQLFDASILVTGDTHHCYLEGIQICHSRSQEYKLADPDDGVIVFEFVTGS